MADVSAQAGATRDVQLLADTLLPGPTLDRFASQHSAAGGVASFTGKVRPDGDVQMLELSHYAPLTLTGMESLADETLGRCMLDGILIHHRTGQMRPGESIVLVAAAARHRRDALEAVDFAMDHLKSDAWFWKRERRADGWRWIEPREQDHADLKRWR